MKRLVVVYNTRSSKFVQVENEVLAIARALKNWAITEFKVAKTDVDDNAEKLAKVLKEGDLVVAVGGDGTTTIALNGVMLTQAKRVTLGVLGYGNFNDMARTLGLKSLEEIIEAVAGKVPEKVAEVWPLECLVNGRHWRWGMCYFVIGLFAEASTVFDERDNRKSLRSGRRGVIYSFSVLARWYLKNRKRQFMESFVLGDSGRELKEATDYIAVNGKSVAKIMRGGKWFLDQKEFQGGVQNLRGFWQLAWFMARSILVRVPGRATQCDVLDFVRPATVMIQAEGEYKRFSDVNKIEVRKAARAVRVVMNNR